MSNTRRFLLATAVATMVFTLSCSFDDGNGDEGGNSNPFSSSSDKSSSSVGGGSNPSSSSDGDYNGSYGTVIDGSGQSYRTVVIGTQTWMAENLNYNPGTGNSACYDNLTSNCATYGRLYDWSTAMALDTSCNSSSCSDQIQTKHRGICPEDWHIPSNEDWDKLFRYVEGTSGTASPYESLTAGRYLKATSGWNTNVGSGTDAYGFSALPGGAGYVLSGFGNVGNYGEWWSTNEYSISSTAYYRRMIYSSESASYYYSFKPALLSVRCLQG